MKISARTNGQRNAGEAQALVRFAERLLTPTAAAIHEQLLADLDAQATVVADEVAAGCLELIPEYDVLAPTDLPSVAEHVRQHLRLFVDCAHELRQPSAAELSFVRRRVLSRSRVGLPSHAIQRAYLMGQQRFWTAILHTAPDHREALRATTVLGMFAMGYAEAACREVDLAYFAMSSHHPYLTSEEELLLVHDLVRSGAPERQPARDAARRLELGDGSSAMVVVVVGDVGEDEHEVATSLRRGLPEDTLMALREEQLVVIVQDAEPGWARSQVEVLLRRLHERGRHQLRAGMSAVVERLRDLPDAHEEALHARRSASAAQPVLALADIDVHDLVAAGADARLARVLPPRLIAWLDADRRSGHEMAQTLRALIDADLSPTRAAKTLGVHRNTVQYRMSRIHELTGYDIRRLADAIELLTVVKVLGSDDEGALPAVMHS